MLHPNNVTRMPLIDDLTLLTTSGDPYPLEQLRGAPSVVVLLRHLA